MNLKALASLAHLQLRRLQGPCESGAVLRQLSRVWGSGGQGLALWGGFRRGLAERAAAEARSVSSLGPG